MTCIIALIDNAGAAWMGGDRAGTDDNGMVDLLATPKIGRWPGGFLWGMSGSPLLLNILATALPPTYTGDRYAMKWEKIEIEGDRGRVASEVPDEEIPAVAVALRWLVWEVVPWLRAAVRAADGWSEAEGMGGAVLVAGHGAIWKITAHGAVHSWAVRYYVMGPAQAEGVLYGVRRTCGWDIDLDRPQVTLSHEETDNGVPPRAMLTLALEAAAHFSGAVRPPFDILQKPQAEGVEVRGQ